MYVCVCVMRECVICVCIRMGECERMCVYACWVYVCVCKCVHMFVDVDGFVGMSVCVCVVCLCVYVCKRETVSKCEIIIGGERWLTSKNKLRQTKKKSTLSLERGERAGSNASTIVRS